MVLITYITINNIHNYTHDKKQEIVFVYNFVHTDGSQCAHNLILKYLMIIIINNKLHEFWCWYMCLCYISIVLL